MPRLWPLGTGVARGRHHKPRHNSLWLLASILLSRRLCSRFTVFVSSCVTRELLPVLGRRVPAVRGSPGEGVGVLLVWYSRSSSDRYVFGRNDFWWFSMLVIREHALVLSVLVMEEHLVSDVTCL